MRQVSLGPVWTGSGSGSGLREGVGAVPPSVTSLALLPIVERAEREGGRAGGAWRLRLGPISFGKERKSVPAVLELCAAFDRPGLPCCLEGRVDLSITPPAVDAGPGALGAYLAQCAELAGQLCSGDTFRGVQLDLKVAGPAAVAGEAAGNGGGSNFFGRVLDAMLPAAAPHVNSLCLVAPGSLSPGFSRHLTAPGLAFPHLSSLVSTASTRATMGSCEEGPSMEAADVAALARLVAPRLRELTLLCPTTDAGPNYPGGGTILGAGSTAAVTALAMGLARPVDADGRPADLRLTVGAHPSKEGDGERLERALVAAGRGWVDVGWYTDYDDYDDYGDYDDYSGACGD